MIKIYLVIFVVLILFVAIRRIRRISPEASTKYQKKIWFFILIATLLVLVVTGKLDALLALLGVFIARMLPMLRYAPVIQKLWFMFKSGGKSKYQQHSVARKNQMTVDEAYQVLGLKPNATKQEIISRHKRLMMKVHPDKGGSDFLATQLNNARHILLK